MIVRRRKRIELASAVVGVAIGLGVFLAAPSHPIRLALLVLATPLVLTRLVARVLDEIEREQ
ncbi:hypothetical protein [Paractinoplanes toevensis]|uniref:Uncharacterized protein n=1 Tax=Paractinoplanes toevensis TaxID=571911 RepID=A0A919WC47_9ACTN|nr:hypothetical protein [Actinoplanes toevensis]GIM97446.1 hypothetical protein Ato02nite_092390 [Actinoplanes toevensis]